MAYPCPKQPWVAPNVAKVDETPITLIHAMNKRTAADIVLSEISPFLPKTYKAEPGHNSDCHVVVEAANHVFAGGPEVLSANHCVFSVRLPI